MTIQSKVLTAIKTAAEAKGYEFATNAHCANVGLIHIDPVGSFQHAISFSYDFQSDYAKFSVYKGGFRVISGSVSPDTPGLLKDTLIHYHHSDRLEAFVKFIVAQLPKIQKKKGKAKDEIRYDVEALVRRVKGNSGTDLKGAVRNIFTELMHLCVRNNVDFIDRFESAQAVYSDNIGLTPAPRSNHAS